MTTNERLADLAAKVIVAMVIDLAGTVDELNGGLKLNRAVIDWIGAVRPATWEGLKARAQARRAKLLTAAPLTASAKERAY